MCCGLTPCNQAVCQLSDITKNKFFHSRRCNCITLLAFLSLLPVVFQETKDEILQALAPPHSSHTHTHTLSHTRAFTPCPLSSPPRSQKGGGVFAPAASTFYQNLPVIFFLFFFFFAANVERSVVTKQQRRDGKGREGEPETAGRGEGRGKTER